MSSPFAPGGESLEKTSTRAGADDLLYSTFIGGASSEYTGGMAIDAADNVYFTGETGMPFEGELFPTTPGVFDPNLYNAEAFVAKFNSTGQPVYISFLGGNGSDWGLDITADASGNAYITGETNGTNGSAFPTTPGAYDVTPDPNDSAPYKDAFMSKVNPSGSTLLYSTFIGPDGVHDTGASIAVDSSGDVYISGQTHSSSFPTTPGAFSTTFGGGDNDAFILKLSPDGAGSADLVYSTFLGGDSSDMINSLVVNGDNEVYAAGVFPVTKFSSDGRCF